MEFFVGDKRSSAGLTLIEIVVGIGIFVSLIGMVGGAYLAMMRTQGEQIQIQYVIGDINNFFEILDREIRTGYGHTFQKYGNGLELVNQYGDCVRYELDANAGKIMRTAWDGWDSVNGQCSTPTAVPDTITSERTDITHVSFGPVVRSDIKEAVTYRQQGRVTVLVGACPRNVDDITSWQDDGRCVTVQTTVTSRQFSVFNPNP